MIRPLLAPFYQSCMCIGMSLALIPCMIFITFGDYQSGGEWFRVATSEWMLALIVFNSIACGWIFLQLRRRGKKDQGPLTGLICLTLICIEYGLAIVWSLGLASLAYVLHALLIYVLIAAVSSLAWYPLGLLVGTMLEAALRRDPTMRIGALAPRSKTVPLSEATR